MRAHLYLLAGVLAGGASAPTFAKPPTLTGLDPSGARQGTAVLVKAAGTFDRWPVKAWSSTPGLTVTPAAEKGEFWFEASSSVPPGTHWARFHDEDGASSPRPFQVGTLPEIAEVEPNDQPGRAQPIDRPAVTVNGKLARNNDVDGFAVPLKRGETLVASLEANRNLGSPMDGLLQVARTDGIVLAENDDDHGRDPQIVFEAPSEGVYVVRVFGFPATPDSRIGTSGGADYRYRLTLSTRDFGDYPFPLAISREGSGPLTVSGWNLPGAPPSRIAVHAEDGTTFRVSDGRLGNLVEGRVLDHPTAVEVEPNPPDAPQNVTPPVGVSGRIDEGRDVDAYRFPARKGEKLTVRVECRSLGLPLDPAVRVLGGDGAVLAESDDTGRGDLDAELTFTPPSDGDYRAVVRDLNRQGGPRAAYLLTIVGTKPDYRLTLDADRFTLSAEKPLEVPVKVDRRNGFDGTVEVSVEGLPEGVTAEPVVSEPKGGSAKSLKLTLKAEGGAGPASGPFRVVGRVKGGDGKDVSVGGAKVDGFPTSTDAPWLSVVKAASTSK